MKRYRIFRDTSSTVNRKIETLSKHMKKFKKDKHSSVGLLKAVNKRKTFRIFKKNNVESYKNVLTKLNLRK